MTSQQSVAQQIASLPDLKYQQTNLTEPAITLLGSEAAMRRFTAKLEGTYKGKPLTGTVYVTQIMVMRDGKWLERFYQVTQLKACALTAEAKAGSLVRDLPSHSLAEEATETLLERPGLRIERIVSTGHATPEGRVVRSGQRRVGAGGQRQRPASPRGRGSGPGTRRRRFRFPSRPLPPSCRLDPTRAADGVAGDSHLHQMLTGTAESDETTHSI